MVLRAWLLQGAAPPTLPRNTVSAPSLVSFRNKSEILSGAPQSVVASLVGDPGVP